MSPISPTLGPYFRLRRWFGLTLREVDWIRDHIEEDNHISTQLSTAYWRDCLTENTIYECNKFLENRHPVTSGEGLKIALIHFLERD